MKPSERIKELIKNNWADPVYNQLDAIIQYLDEEWQKEVDKRTYPHKGETL